MGMIFPTGCFLVTVRLFACGGHRPWATRRLACGSGWEGGDDLTEACGFLAIEPNECACGGSRPWAAHTEVACGTRYRGMKDVTKACGCMV